MLGVKTALNANGRYRYKPPAGTVDTLVVGAGVVGLSIAQRLCEKLPLQTTYLVERHSRAGEETSSRNSEVIHSGLYYPPTSLKTRLCLRGRELMYDRCWTHNVPFRKTGKLVVARHDQLGYIEDLHAKAMKLQWPAPSSRKDVALPTELISGDRARELEPNLSPAIVAALWSPETGIVDSHELMGTLEKEILESESSEIVYSTKVVRVDPHEGGWVVQVVTGEADGSSSDALLVRTLVNASGLSAHHILNSLLPEESRIPIYYARGSYASYSGPGAAGISRLIYPCPRASTGHSFQSLGTHLTLDLQGKVRFGPDLEWIEPDESSGPDYWMKHLVPQVAKMGEMHAAVNEYLNHVSLEGMQPDYAGIRPKLVGPRGGFQDFVVRLDKSGDFDGKAGKGKMITLLGIESPGLTSSLALAEHVVDKYMCGPAGE